MPSFPAGAAERSCRVRDRRPCFGNFRCETLSGTRTKAFPTLEKKVLPDILHPCVIGSSRWTPPPPHSPVPKKPGDLWSAVLVCDPLNTRVRAQACFFVSQPFPDVTTVFSVCASDEVSSRSHIHELITGAY